MTHDIVIRGGEIVDGTGSKRYLADLAIDDSMISAIGKVDGKSTGVRAGSVLRHQA